MTAPRGVWRSRVGLVAATAMLLSACASSSDSVGASAEDTVRTADTEATATPPSATAAPTATAVSPSPEPTATPSPSPTPVPEPEPVTVEGTVVSSVDGSPVGAATVSLGSATATTGADGSFVLTEVVAEAGVVTVNRPAWQSASVEWLASSARLVIELDQILVKGLRVSAQVAGDSDRFDALLKLADDTVVNAFVFDTKDESGQVLYYTDVALANEIGAATDIYDPSDLLARAKEHDLYTITRVVTFEDPLWAGTGPGAQLPGPWVDAADPQNWEYPLALAVEACELGFDEVQFDYVRFPVGQLSANARAQIPDTEEGRSEAITGFLGEARALLHARGCAVSAAIFGIVMSSETDEGLGQTPETVSAVVDAVSPMLYPSHYSPGWLGFADPNDHPGPVIAHALDTGADRLAPGSVVRPWLQGFYYNGEQVRAEIEEADSRGAGWIIWSANGTYGQSWLPLE